MSDRVRINVDIHIDKEVKYKLRRSGVLPTDVLSIDNSTLYFDSGALHKLQAAIDVYFMEQHTQSKEHWRTEAADAEAK